jgi:hypothetical protein
MGTPKGPREWLDNVLSRADVEIPSLCMQYLDNPGKLLKKLPPIKERVIDALGALRGSVELNEEIFARRERQVRGALAESPGQAPSDERTERFVHHVATIYALAENANESAQS